MLWFVVLGALAVAAGVFAVLRERGRTRGAEPSEATADALAGLLPSLARIAAAEAEITRVVRAVATVLPPPEPVTGCAGLARAYRTAGDRLARLSADLRRGDPSDVMVRLARMAGHVAVDLDDRRDAGAVDAVRSRLRELRLEPADVQAFGVEPVEDAITRYVRLCGDGLAVARRDLLTGLATAGNALRSESNGLLMSAGHDDLRRVAAGLRRAVMTRADALAHVRASRDGERAPTRRERAALVRRDGGIREQVAAADALLARGDAPGALTRLATVAVPSGADVASAAFAAACRSAAVGLHGLAVAREAVRADVASRAGDVLDRHATRLADALAAARDGNDRLRREAFGSVLAAADRICATVAQALIAGAGPAPLGPAADAAGILLVGDRAADNLTRRIGEIIPRPPSSPDPSAVDERALRRAGLLVTMDRHAAALAGVDGVLMAALGPSGAEAAHAALASTVAALAGVPPELGRAMGDAGAYLHAGLGHDVAQVAGDFGHKLVQDVLPQLPSEGWGDGMLGVAANLHETVSSFQDSLLGELVAGGGVLHAAAHFVGNEIMGSVQDLAGLALQSASVQDALGHLDVAGHALAAGAGHAAAAAGDLVASHLPFVTLVVSTAHEIRRHREHGTTIAQSVGNVALDVGGVWAGAGAAAALGAALGVHGGPVILLTVPGAVAGRLATRQYRKRRLERATEAFDAAKDGYDASIERLVRGFTTAVDGQLAAARRDAAGLPRAPRSGGAGPAGDQIRAALHTYRLQVEAVLDAAARAGSLDPRGVEAARSGLARLESDLAVEPSRALAGAAAVPFHPAWGPAAEFARQCTAVTVALRDRSDAHQRSLGHWVHDVAAAVGTTRQRVRAVTEREIAALNSGRDEARGLLDEAAQAVLLCASALHGRTEP